MPHSKAVAKKYNLVAALYDFLLPRYIQQTIGAALKDIELTPHQKILDIGCGTGPLEETLLKKFPQMDITALDLSPQMLKAAQKKFEAPHRIRWIEGDFLELALPTKHFDIAFSLSNFHYFPKPEAVLQKCVQILKPGGQIIIVDWDRNSWKGRLYNWGMKKWDTGFQKAYTLAEMQQMLGQNGFVFQKGENFKTSLFWTMMSLVAETSDPRDPAPRR